MPVGIRVSGLKSEYALIPARVRVGECVGKLIRHSVILARVKFARVRAFHSFT